MVGEAHRRKSPRESAERLPAELSAAPSVPAQVSYGRSVEGPSSSYPTHRAVDVVLKNGSTVRFRPVTPTDASAVLEFFGHLSPDSLRMRFHGGRHLSIDDVRPFVEVDYSSTFGLVAVTTTNQIAALANYVRTGESRAEFGIAIADALQGLGLGSLLLEHLAEAAADAGISLFEAEVLASNAAMLDVIRSTKLPVEQSSALGVVHCEFPTSLSQEALEAFEHREAVAAAAGVARFLRPRSVAVIGASRTRGTIGAELFRNVIDLGFEGPVYPVNPSADVVQSVAAYPDVGSIPGPVDLAVIVVPARLVLDVVEQCGQKGVGALLIISSGFAEVGEGGSELQRDLMRIVRLHGMRVVGPNCMGLMNLDPEIRLNATFSPIYPPPGRLAFSSQSGALGIAVIDQARELGLGMSSFVSVGNKADISGNDLIQYWEQDENTDVVLLYLESFGNPRKFARIARRAAKKKPIVAVKSGRSKAGARAAASHTGSFAAGDVAVDALFRQAGVTRTDTLEELFDVASLLAHQPLPRGRSVGILTNAGGLGILCADACSAAGLEVPELSDESSSALRAMLPAEASVANPVDMIASATAEQYGRALHILAADPKIDSIIVIFIPPLVTKAEDVAQSLMTASEDVSKTLLACFLGVRGVHGWLRNEKRVIPSYVFPESAARALGKVAERASWLARGEGTIPDLDDVDRDAGISLGAELALGGERWLQPDAVERLLKCYGIRAVKSRTVKAPEEVAEAAGEIGGPVAVKVVSSTILHKTDVGGVQLNLETPEEAATAARKIVEDLTNQGLASGIDGLLVQEMVGSEGAEMFVGVNHDPSFGPLLACGAGGVLVELMRDVTVRITPVTDLDATEMLRSLRTFPILEGYRGSPRLDIEELESLLLRVSRMVEDIPHLGELDLNPVIVLPQGRGAVVVDARMKIVPAEPETPRGSRRPISSRSGRNTKTLFPVDLGHPG